MISNFVLFSRDSPLASSLVLGLGLILDLGYGLFLGLGNGLTTTTKGLYFLTSIIFYI